MRKLIIEQSLILQIEFNKFKFISRYKYVSRTRTTAGQGGYDRLYSTDNIKVMDLSLKYSINSNFMVESKILNLYLQN